MAEFGLVATGGTFDIIHAGHRMLLSKAFDASSRVIIGLVSDELARKKGKKTIHNYQQRLKALTLAVTEDFAGHSFQISKLDNDFGPAVLEKDMQALVVSEEMQGQGHLLNSMRAERNLRPVKIVVVPMVLAEDMARISTTRIKNSEIDTDGNLLSVDK